MARSTPKQDFLDQGLQFQRALGRRHPFGGAHQQRIIEQRAEPPEAVAHGRLRETQLVGCLGHIALTQQDLEVDQQVEINLVQLFHIMSLRRSRPYSRDEL